MWSSLKNIYFLLLINVLSQNVFSSIIFSVNHTRDEFVIGNITRIILKERSLFNTLVIANEGNVSVKGNFKLMLDQINCPVVNIGVLDTIRKMNQIYYVNNNFAAAPEDNIFLLLFLTKFETSRIVKNIQRLQTIYFWRARQKIMIVAVEQDQNNYWNQTLDDVFSFLQSEMILNCVLFFDTNIGHKIVTHNPFTEEIINCESESTTCFPNKVENFYGKPLKVSMEENRPDIWQEDNVKGGIRYEGKDGDLLQTVMDHVNATLVYVKPQDKLIHGRVLRPGIVTGTLGDVYYGRVDFGFNSRFYLQEQLHYVEGTYPSERDDLTILIPRAKPIPDIENYGRIFSLTSLKYIGISMMTFLVIGFSLARYEKRFLNILFQYGVFISDLVRLTIMASVRTKYFAVSLRVCLLTYGIFCFVMCNAFSANLISVLTVRQHLPEINTIDDLIKSGIIVRTFPRYIKMLETQLQRKELQVLNQFAPIEEKELLSEIFYNHRTGYMMKGSTARFYLKHPMNYIGKRPLYHIMQEKPIPELISYIARFGSPYMQRIDTIIQRAHESGLMNYWDEMHLNLVSVISQHWIPDAPPQTHPEEILMQLKLNRDTQSNIPLSITSFTLPFSMFIVGNCFALFVFLVELFMFYCKQPLFTLVGFYLLHIRDK